MGREIAREANRLRRRRWLRLLMWAIFGAGLLVQMSAPRLKIVNRTFIIPSAPPSRAIDPAAMIARERMMQLLSAVLTLSGAAGLGLCYRSVLVRARSL